MITSHLGFSAGSFGKSLQEQFGVPPIIVRFSDRPECLTGCLPDPLTALGNRKLKMCAAIVCQIGNGTITYVVAEVPNDFPNYSNDSKVVLLEPEWIPQTFERDFTQVNDEFRQQFGDEAAGILSWDQLDVPSNDSFVPLEQRGARGVCCILDSLVAWSHPAETSGVRKHVRGVGILQIPRPSGRTLSIAATLDLSGLPEQHASRLRQIAKA